MSVACSPITTMALALALAVAASQCKRHVSHRTLHNNHSFITGADHGHRLNNINVSVYRDEGQAAQMERR